MTASLTEHAAEPPPVFVCPACSAASAHPDDIANVAWQKYLNGQPCADGGLGPCDGPHERSYFTWWLKPGPLHIVCARHGEARAESVED